MNTQWLPQGLLQFIADEALLGRVLLASLEMLALGVLVWIAIRVLRPKSARLVQL